MRKVVIVLIFVWLLIGTGIGWLIIEGRNTKWFSPLATKIIPREMLEGHEIIGFLPPWMIEKAVIYPEIFDQLIFLGIEVEADGDLVWDSQSKKIDSERYLIMKRQMKQAGKKNIIGLKLFEDKKIEALMTSTEARKNLIEQVGVLIKEDKFDGVNVDFEYQGDAKAVLKDEFVTFLGELRKAVGKPVSVDVFANTIIKGNEMALEKMVNEVDYVIVMAYDFHRTGMDYAGPVAPIGSEAGSRNIMEVVDRVVGLNLNKQKFILAYPLYGYEWKTVDESFGAATIGGWGQMASYKRVADLLKDPDFVKGAKVSWDEQSMSPWLSFTETETAYKRVKSGTRWKSVAYEVEVVHQIYYEDLRSLSAKFSLAKNSQMGGVGFWALGYEGGYVEVWSELKKIVSGI